nr:uncharacterized protein LOC106781075 [Equus caballus]
MNAGPEIPPLALGGCSPPPFAGLLCTQRSPRLWKLLPCCGVYWIPGSPHSSPTDRCLRMAQHTLEAVTSSGQKLQQGVFLKWTRRPSLLRLHYQCRVGRCVQQPPTVWPKPGTRQLLLHHKPPGSRDPALSIWPCPGSWRTVSRPCLAHLQTATSGNRALGAQHFWWQSQPTSGSFSEPVHMPTEARALPASPCRAREPSLAAD